MKKVLVTLIMILTLCVQVRPQEKQKGRPFEAFVPDSLYLLIRTTTLKDCLASVNYVVDRLLVDTDRSRVFDGIARIERKTGIDLLDEKSLTKTGIDLSRRAGIAYYPGKTSDDEGMAIFVPVLDEKAFPLKFTEIMSRAAGKIGAEMYPAVTQYRSHNVQQIGKDIFTTAIDGYFVIASCGELLHNIIDTAENGAGSVALDPVFSDYLKKIKGPSDIDLFIRREFMTAMTERFIEIMNGAEDEKSDSGREQNDELVPGPMTDRPTPEKRQDIKPVHADGWFTSINFAAVGISVKKDKLDVEIGADFISSDAVVNSLLEALKTSALGSSLYTPDANTLFLLSLEFAQVEKFCADGGALCSYYTEFKKKFLTEFAMDFQAEVLPAVSGPLSFLMGSDSFPTLNSNSAIFFTLRDAGAVRALSEKAAVRLASLGKKGDVWGESEIGGARAFWYVSPSGRKSHMVFEKRGVFTGNSADLIEVCMKGTPVSGAKKGNDISARIGSDMFLLARIKKNSFLKTLLMMQTGKSGRGMNFFQKTGSIFLTGRKTGGYVSFLLDVEIQGGEK